MKNKQNLILGLLVISVGFNFFGWQELQSIKQNQQDMARTYDVDSLRNEINAVTQAAQNMLKEKQWVQNTDFVLKPESLAKTENPESMELVLKGEWSLGEIGKSQVPQLWLREAGTDNWEKSTLKDNGSLTFIADLKVSPEKHYEYKLVAEGDPMRASEIQEVPYHLYGLPTGFVDIGFHSDNNETVVFDLHLNFDSAAPVVNVEPKEAYIELVRNGSVEKKLKFEEDPGIPEINVFSTRWEVKKDILPEYKPYLVVKYENGLTKRSEIEVFEKVRYEVEVEMER